MTKVRGRCVIIVEDEEEWFRLVYIVEDDTLLILFAVLVYLDEVE